MSTEKTNPCNIFVGAETGLIKGVKISAESKSWINVNSVQSATREKEAVALSWADANQTEFYSGLRDRTVNVYSRSDPQVLASYPDTGGEGTLTALASWNKSLITCTDKGHLRVTKDDQCLVSIDVGDNLHCMRQNPQKPSIVATGGKENELKLWNLDEPGAPIFAAKNVKNDWLNLRVPVWVTDVAFIPESERVVTCTGHHQVRVYDPSTPQKRPVLDVEIDEYPIMCMSLRQGYDQVLVGNTHGLMALVDFRGKGYMVQKYKGFAGAIRSVHCHPSNGTVTSCGLDRFLRVHDIDNKHLLHKVYLKSRLNCVLVADDWAPSQPEESNIQMDQSEGQDISERPKVNTDAEAEEIWENMEVVGKKASKEDISGPKDQDSGAFSGSENSCGSENEEVPQKRTKSQKAKGSKKKKCSTPENQHSCKIESEEVQKKTSNTKKGSKKKKKTKSK